MGEAPGRKQTSAHYSTLFYTLSSRSRYYRVRPLREIAGRASTRRGPRAPTTTGRFIDGRQAGRGDRTNRTRDGRSGARASSRGAGPPVSHAERSIRRSISLRIEAGEIPPSWLDPPAPARPPCCARAWPRAPPRRTGGDILRRVAGGGLRRAPATTFAWESRPERPSSPTRRRQHRARVPDENAAITRAIDDTR